MKPITLFVCKQIVSKKKKKKTFLLIPSMLKNTGYEFGYKTYWRNVPIVESLCGELVGGAINTLLDV